MAAIAHMGSLEAGSLGLCGVLGYRVAKFPGVLRCMEHGIAEH